MRKVLTILFVLFLCLSFSEIHSQNKVANDSIVKIIDKMPQFKGGVDALVRYMERNLRYPKKLDNSITGRVRVRFVVTKDGSIDKAEVVESVHPEMDKEALRVVKKMPKWIPGEKEGEPVSVYFTIPILFHQRN